MNETHIRTSEREKEVENLAIVEDGERSLTLPVNSFTPPQVEKIFESLDLTEKSRVDYLYRIPTFLDFIKTSGGLHRNSFINFKRFLSKNDQIKTSTKSKFLLVSRVFLQQLYRLGILKVDLTSGIKGFKMGSVRKTNGLTDGEVQKIIKGLDGQQDVRLKPIVVLKLFSGLRDIEIVRLKVEHLQLEDSIILVDGKGTDGNLEPLNVIPFVKTVLVEFLEKTGKRSGHVFSSLSSNNLNGQMTTQSVWKMVRDFLDGLGIHRVPHSFRGFFVTELVKKLSNVFEVQYFTRHKSIQSVQHYFNMVERNSNLPKYMTSFDSILQPS